MNEWVAWGGVDVIQYKIIKYTKSGNITFFTDGFKEIIKNDNDVDSDSYSQIYPDGMKKIMPLLADLKDCFLGAL